MLRVLDLFSGIGGFSLGLERTGGFKTVAFCEIEDYPRRVLAKHWPEVPIYHDVRELTAETLRRDGIAVDVICGGFPCQDVSFAGKRAGLEGARSGLWREYARLIGELRPRYVIVENVPGLLNLGMGTVLGDLSSLGYDAVWDCIPASAVGAPHRRDRVWIVAYTAVNRRGQGVPDDSRRKAGIRPREEFGFGNGRKAMADANSELFDRSRTSRTGRRFESSNRREICNPNVSGLAFRKGQPRDVGEELATSFGADWWFAEPAVGRVAHGIPNRVGQLKALGNSVVPQIPELIGRAILASLQHPLAEAAE